MFINPLPLIVTLVGGYFLFKLRFFFIIHPFSTMKKAFGGLKDSASFSSLTLALAGTLGVGNVFGVCVGISLGGAGSVFWLFISGIFASVIKYCEVVISADSRMKPRADSGGMAHVVRASSERYGGLLFFAYALFCLLLAFVLGAAIQGNTLVSTFAKIFNTPMDVFVLALLILVLLAVLGGTEKIIKMTSFLIPVSTIIYICITLSIIVIHSSRLNEVVLQILHDAFTVKGGIGGLLGFITSSSIREGYSRGILSNEAGAGTSTMAHTKSNVLNPAALGIMGIIEVIFDTWILCMLTAFAILLPGFDSSLHPMEIMLGSIEKSLPACFNYAFLFCIFVFAYSTIICWYCYGAECVGILKGRRGGILYSISFLAALGIGCFADEYTLVVISDILLLLLTVICSFGLIKNSDRIKHLSERGGIINVKSRSGGVRFSNETYMRKRRNTK